MRKPTAQWISKGRSPANATWTHPEGIAHTEQRFQPYSIHVLLKDSPAASPPCPEEGCTKVRHWTGLAGLGRRTMWSETDGCLNLHIRRPSYCGAHMPAPPYCSSQPPTWIRSLVEACMIDPVAFEEQQCVPILLQLGTNVGAEWFTSTIVDGQN
jgi:hypothetical protein